MKSVLSDKRAIGVLLGPALLVYTLVMLLPMLWSLGYTFFTGSVLGGFDFAGFANFERFWNDRFDRLDAYVRDLGRTPTTEES